MNLNIEVWQSVGIIAGAIVGIAAVVTLLWRFGKFLWKLGKNAATFFEDWNGTPARPGVAAVPGVMERLDNQDAKTTMVVTRLQNVERHVGNGNPVPMRAVVEAHTTAINDILGVVGTRQTDIPRDSLANYLPSSGKKGTAKG